MSTRDEGVTIKPQAEDGPAEQPKAKKTNRGHPSRGQRVAPQRSAARANREFSDASRQDDGFSISSEDRAAMLRNAALQGTLPDPPKIPGVHWFWGTTNKDAKPPLKWYLTLGYKIVRSEDPRLKGWADSTRTGHGGEFDGCVCVNEMVLLWCPQSVYLEIMRVVHHDRPLEEGERLREKRTEIADEIGRDSRGKQLVTNEGDDLALLDRQNAKVKPGTARQFE